MIECFSESADIKQRQIQLKTKREFEIKERDRYLFNRFCFAACLPIVIIFILVFMTQPKAFTSNNYLLLIFGFFFLLTTINSARKIIQYDKNKNK